MTRDDTERIKRWISSALDAETLAVEGVLMWGVFELLDGEELQPPLAAFTSLADAEQWRGERDLEIEPVLVDITARDEMWPP